MVIEAADRFTKPQLDAKSEAAKQMLLNMAAKNPQMREIIIAAIKARQEENDGRSA